MILRYRPSESVTHESELQCGERWSTQAKRWTATGIARDLCCSHCGKMIVEEDKTVFYMRSMTGAGAPTYSHAWCHMVSSVNVDSMHHADGDYGDCMRRFVDEVARSLTVEEMAFPSMRCYQKFLTALIYFELCDHDEECPCSAENCSRLLTEDLKREKHEMTHYMQIAWKCGHLNTVDGLVDVYHSIADYFHPGLRFSLLDILDEKDTVQKMWARNLANTMLEIVRSVTKKQSAQLARDWLRTSVHLQSDYVQERLRYCKVVDTYYKLDVLGCERQAIQALHEASNGSTISPLKK